MVASKHGLSVGMERVRNKYFLSLKAAGKLTHEDYGTIKLLIDSALESVKHPKVKILIDGSELDGWELRRAWDDFKLGLKNGNQFDKIAIFGDETWLEQISNISSWFESGEVKYFDDSTTALEWLQI
jgi:hypothetical protein